MTPWEWRDQHVLTPAGPEDPSVRLVLCVLARHIGANDHCWPSVKLIAGATGYSERTVQGALGDAETAGWLRREAVPGRVTRYFPAIPGDPRRICTPAESAGAPPQSLRGAPQNLRPTPAESAPESGKEGGKEVHQGKEGLPTCPLCSAPMEKKQSRKGKSPPFWGCTMYVRSGCKGKLEVDDAPRPPPRRPAVPQRTRDEVIARGDLSTLTAAEWQARQAQAKRNEPQPVGAVVSQVMGATPRRA